MAGIIRDNQHLREMRPCVVAAEIANLRILETDFSLAPIASPIAQGIGQTCHQRFCLMGPHRISDLFVPIARAIGQLDDRAFSGVVLRSLGWSLACVVALHAAMIWAVHRLLAFHGWMAWAADILGSVGASLLAFWLFVPVAAGIGMFYCDRIASAVERRFYPWLPKAQSAPIFEQVWDGVALALNVLLLSMAALVLVLVIPGLGLLLGWLIGAYAIGRGLFVGVAMRRMPRAMAESLYRRRRGTVLAHGGILALAAYVPFINLFIPVIGTAAMVHILDISIIEAHEGGRFLVRHRMDTN